jgi:hypothetical protein
MEHEPQSTTSGKSIVIGMSVPEHEADVHAHSAHTPGTPAIILHPAQQSESWKPVFLQNARPASSIYSSHLPHVTTQSGTTQPPVPRIPRIHAERTDPDQQVVGASVVASNDHPNQRALPYPDYDDYDDIECTADGRMSTDSRERIVTMDLEDRRHKSQGWWNLMLSPMLSRKGTLVDKSQEKKPDLPPVPAIPADVRLSKTAVVSPLTSESPGTPRRAGLASARASVWSRWTTWEKSKDSGHVEPEKLPEVPAAQPLDVTTNSAGSPPMPQVDCTKGLAAEYYHACAVEQLTGVPYFECEGHSCAANWPPLQSIFDKSATVEASRFVDDTETPKSAHAIATGGLATLAAAHSESAARASIQSEPEVMSPNVRQANTAAVVRARSIKAPETLAEEAHKTAGTSQKMEAPTKTPAAPSSATVPQDVARYCPAVRGSQSPMLSPGPVSPAMARTMTSQGAVAMTQVGREQYSPRMTEQAPVTKQQQTLYERLPPATIIHNNSFYARSNPFEDPADVEREREPAMRSFESGPTQPTSTTPPRKHTEQSRSADSPEPKEEKEKSRLWSKVWKLRNLFSKKQSPEHHAKKSRKWLLIIGSVLLLIVIACILLATLIVRKGTGTPVQQQWLNLTGYPPMPTGISTIARPDITQNQPNCVTPSSLWSCALPQEDQFEVKPNDADQPNFRFQIAFRNGTVPSNMTIPIQSQKVKRAKDPFTNDLFTPSPTPPSRADQIFMGNTTDNITQPFEGEQTPFFVTFISTFPIDPTNISTSAPTNSNTKRQASNSPIAGIPPPDTLSDGTAAPANLLPNSPFPFSQPIKLYNRGQQDEHYGFYMYFDRSIFLHSISALNLSSTNNDTDPLDVNGGATLQNARLRCTFSQTRFLVRMWTNPGFGATLLSPLPGPNDTSVQNSSATDFSRPGSFPYPTTITLDRHGGNVNKKLVYCYGITALQAIQADSAGVVPEIRSFGGQLINPAPTLVNTTGSANGDDFNQDEGGIDGGTGGCGCSWQNWI